MRPLVKRKLGLKEKTREGRGYSLGELRTVGLDLYKAKSKKIPIDKFRRSTHDFNIERLKKLLNIE